MPGSRKCRQRGSNLATGFFFLWEDPNTTISAGHHRPTSETPFKWRADDDSTLNACLVALTHIAKNYISCDFSGGGGSGPLAPPLWTCPCIYIDALSVNISSQPPQTQNMTSPDIFVQPISKHIPTPSLVSLSDLSIFFIG